MRPLLAAPLPVGAALALADYNAIDAFVEQERRRLNVPGISLVIVDGDQLVHARGFGRARPGGLAPTPQTPFLIGSLTKSFTALAVMQLCEAGKIDLDAPVQCYLPWFRVADPAASARITVRHLLTQTSGLPTSAGEVILADFDQRPGASERQARALATLELAHPAGTAWEYSNSNYQLLGLIIEAASGESFAGYIHQHIFAPLGMNQATTSPAEAKHKGLAVGHQYWFGQPVPVPQMPFPPGALAGGGLVANAEDLARYLIAHLNGGRCGETQILSSAGIDTLHHGAVEFSEYGLSMQYGMGWFVSKLGPARLVWHSGTLPDFFSYLALLPEQKKGVALLFNACHHWMNPVLTGVGMGATALLAGDRPTTHPAFRLIPQMLRGQLLVPALQVAGVAATLLHLRGWRLHPERCPSGRRKRALRLGLPIIADLAVASTLISVLGKRRDYLKLYMPDFDRVARVCGSFALVWSTVRTALLLRAFKETL
jgi:CubicO group peptidase (beta-lactamase class C family)